MRVAEVTTTSLVTVGADTPLKAAATAMLDAGVSGLPVAPDAVEVAVEDGVVTLSGNVEARGDAAIVE